jgi:peroxiredoxin
MNVLDAGNAFPKLTVVELQGGMLTLGTPRGDHDWQLVVVYRGLHCPICKKYLSTLDGLVADFNKAGVDVVAVSGDPKDKAREMAQEQDLSLTIGYDMSIAQPARNRSAFRRARRFRGEWRRQYPDPRHLERALRAA